MPLTTSQRKIAGLETIMKIGTTKSLSSYFCKRTKSISILIYETTSFLQLV